MKRFILGLVAILLATPAFAQLQNYQPGPRLIDGNQLNLMVAVVNGLTGNSGAASKGYFSLNTTSVPGPTPETGTVIQAVGANAATSRIENDAFGGVPIITNRRADGTKAAPTAILSTEQLGAFNFVGAVSSTAYYGPAASLRAYATENWSGTAGGSKIVFSTTPNTTQTLTDAVTIDQDQSITIKATTVTGLLRTTFGTPTIASGACGTTTNGVITSGTNQAGLITIGAASTTTCTVSFSATLSAAPNACIAFPASAGAAATGTTVARVSSVTTGGFVITGSALASTAYYYLCI